MHGGYFDLDKTKTEIKALEYEVNKPDFWQDQDNAKKVSKKMDGLREEVAKWEEMKKEVEDTLEIAQLDHDDQSVNLTPELQKRIKELELKFEKLEFFMMFADKHDKNDAIVAIHSGTGGVEAQDWAEMLLRMILRFCEKKGFQAKIMHESKGSEAGIKSAVVEVSGKYAFGYLKSEAGVHRLVRISPFDAEKMRHTSFALIEVIPELEEAGETEIKESDLKINTFRSSGPGGQHANVTDSAVRINHLPTGIVVTCQNERSQQQNKEFALKMLKGKLHQLSLVEKEEEKQKLRGEYQSAEWGNQIRSYVMQPYKMVKDHRNEYQEPDPEAVLGGELEGFIEAYLKWKVGGDS